MSTVDRAAEILQRAHDYIEVAGFDIGQYAEVSGEEGQRAATILVDEDNRWHAANITKQCCYIGTIRLAAGIDPEPDNGGCGDPAVGDGPELQLAFDAIENVVEKYAPTNKARSEYEDAGRFIEALGFEIRTKFCDEEGVDDYEDLTSEDRERLAEKEKAYALKILRVALTEIYA